MKIAGAAGVGAVVAPVEHLAGVVAAPESNVAEQKIVAKRPFGNSGVDISILSQGGAIDFTTKQLLLRQAFTMGVRCWDTSHDYIGGKSEKGIGKYFSKFPEDRKKVFLITKSGASEPEGLTQNLNKSLERMKTDYIDLFLIQAVSDVKSTMQKEIRVWADHVKSAGKIHFFGFATHKNMENCLTDAAQLGWIDGIISTYNYRLMHTDGMKNAVDNCTRAGIGLIAMKSQAVLLWNPHFNVGKETDVALKLNQIFIDKGFTTEQARLKSVWESPAITSICSHMTNMTILQANVAAATDKAVLTSNDRQLMAQYARETSCGYCTGCAEICEEAISHAVPISDIMRFLMYYDSYGDQQQAIQLFKNLPSDTRKRMMYVNYAKAEQCCPQRIPISQLMQEAATKFAC